MASSTIVNMGKALDDKITNRFSNYIKTELATIASSDTSTSVVATKDGYISVWANGAATPSDINIRIRDSYIPEWGESRRLTLPAYASEPILFFPVISGATYLISITGHSSSCIVYQF